MTERTGGGQIGPTIGIAGCGAMGLPMARALLAAGFRVVGFDVRPAAEFGDFARLMGSVEALREADVLVSVVRDTGQTLDLCFDRQAVFAGSRHPRLCLLASTVSPRFVQVVRDRLPAGVTLVDTPMSGAPVAAVERRLTFMVGAVEEDTTARAIAPLLRAMGRQVHWLGGLGRGMACKVLNNFVAVSSVAAVRQVLAEAPRLGVAPEALLAVMKASSGATWFGDNIDAISWSREDYDPANTIGILEKDANALLDALAGLEPAPDGETLRYMQTLRDRMRRLPKAPP